MRSPRTRAASLLVAAVLTVLASGCGAGGFGEVWRATHIVDGADVRTVAIKLLDGPGAGGDAGWLDEVRAVLDVVCDAVPTIFDAGIADGGKLAFIAMELMEGGSLRPLIGDLSLPQTARVLEDLLAAVAYADQPPHDQRLMRASDFSAAEITLEDAERAWRSLAEQFEASVSG